MIINMIGGSGGASLNYTVVGGTSAPSSPKENTIWVNTSTTITSHVFSAEQPTGSAGMVWFQVSTSSSVEFNALKKNVLQVYPLSAKQYVSGAWVDKTAMSYLDGIWVDWITWIYKNGDECSDQTGGWTSAGYTYNNQSISSGTKETNKITLSSVNQKVASLGTQNAISLDGINVIEVDVDIVKINSSYPNVNGAIVVSQSKNFTLNGINTAFGSTVGKKTVKLDVSSLSGNWFVIVTTSLSASGSTVDVFEIRMK